MRRVILETLELLGGSATGYDILKFLVNQGFAKGYDEMNRLQSKIYYHLKKMVEVGLLKVKASKRVNAPVEKKYIYSKI